MEGNNEHLIQQAALFLYRNIKGYKFEEVKDILDSVEFQVDTPITDTQMSGFSYACSLSDNSEARKQYNFKLLTEIYAFGPALDFKDKVNRTPLHHAARASNLTAVDFILGQLQNNPEQMNNLVNTCSIGNETPLMKAAEQGSVQIVQKLLQAGANPFIQNARGRTADQYAQSNQPESGIHTYLQQYMLHLQNQQQQLSQQQQQPQDG